MARALSGALVLVLASSACEVRTTTPAFTTSDSAGITIAISTTPVWDVEPASRWSLSPEPVLDLAATGAGPLHEFFGVAGATVQDDGRIVVADAGSNQVRSFSSSGASLGVVGREGEGPEDYNGIGLLHRVGH